MIENKENLEKRMYFFVPRNISDIQKGIQCGHAVEQYAFKYGDTEVYKDYVQNHKTWIILDGGTTNGHRTAHGEAIGTLNQILDSLVENEIDHGYFFEPDLNNALTAICFLVDERVFNNEKYINIGESFDEFYDLTEQKEEFENFVKLIGGKKNIFLKNLITNKKLA